MFANHVPRFLRTDGVRPYQIHRHPSLMNRLARHARVGWLFTAILLVLLATAVSAHYTQLASDVVARCIP